MTRRPVAEEKEAADWTPRVRRINAPDVGEHGKLTFIRSLIGERRFDEAAEELKGLLITNPRSYLGNLNMGRLLERKGQLDQAVEHFETARAANPIRVEAPLLAGKAYVGLEDLDHASEAFEAALQLDPKQAAAHFGLAQVHFSRNEFELAETRLEQALMLDPQLKPARALQARIHNRRGDDEAAQRSIEELLSTAPGLLKPTMALARIHLKHDQPTEALALLQSAVAHHENDVQLWTLLGRAKQFTKDYAGAEDAFRRALAIDPRQRDVPLHLVDTLVPQGKLSEARKILDRMPEMARRRGRVQASYGNVHMAAKNYKQAAEAYRAALLRRKNGETVVDAIKEQTLQDGSVDWQMVAERYQTTLREVRRAAAEGGERTARRRSQVERRRQAARAKA